MCESILQLHNLTLEIDIHSAIANTVQSLEYETEKQYCFGTFCGTKPAGQEGFGAYSEACKQNFSVTKCSKTVLFFSISYFRDCM